MAVTATQVKNLLPDCTIDDLVVESVISDITTFYQAAISVAECTLMSDDEVDSVIKWLSAHALAVGVCRQVLREKLGEAEVEYDKQKGEGLSSSGFGRMALSLDRCNVLDSEDKRPIKIRAITSFE